MSIVIFQLCMIAQLDNDFHCAVAANRTKYAIIQIKIKGEA